LEPAFEDHRFHIAGQSFVFQFDIQQTFRSELVEDFGKKRYRFPKAGVEPSQFFVRHPSHAPSTACSSVDRVVVDHNHLAVSASADVEFETIRSGLQCFSE
jgi:hypothetical protein